MRQCENERGVIGVQVAITLGMFLFVTFGVIDLALIMYRCSALEQALKMSGRQAIVSLSETDQERAAKIRQNVLRFADQFNLRLNAADVSICRAQEESCEGDFLGSAGQFVRISASVPVSILLMPWFRYATSVVMRNEQPLR